VSEILLSITNENQSYMYIFICSILRYPCCSISVAFGLMTCEITISQLLSHALTCMSVTIYNINVICVATIHHL